MRNGQRGIACHRLSAGVSRRSSGKLISTSVAHLTLNPILKVLSSIQAHRVRALLMGGQACVFYGAAEFSRDTDLAILASSENLTKLNKVLRVDVMTKMRGVESFPKLWTRRTTISG